MIPEPPFVKPQRAVWLPKASNRMTRWERIRLIIILLLIGAGIAFVCGCAAIGEAASLPFLFGQSDPSAKPKLDQTSRL